MAANGVRVDPRQMEHRRVSTSPPVVLLFLRNSWVARITALVLFMGAWQWTSASVETLYVPTIGEVASATWGLARDGVIVDQFKVSLLRLLAGFVVTVPLGMVIGVVVGRYRWVEAALHDFIVIGITFPYLITALLVAMWFGFDGVGPTIIMVTAAIPYVILNVSEGVKAVDKGLVDIARAYGVSETRIVRHIILPTTYTFLFAALRLAFSVGWRALIMGEVFAATVGAGTKLSFYWGVGREAEVVAMGLYFAIFALLMERVFAATSARVFRWRPTSVAVAAPRIQ